MSSHHDPVADYNQREEASVIKLNIMKIVEFLDKFDQQTRNKLASLNSRLGGLERNLEFIEHLGRGLDEKAIDQTTSPSSLP
jgi:hypothetical protein